MQGELAEEALSDFEVELGLQVAGDDAGRADGEGPRAGGRQGDEKQTDADRSRRS